MKRLGLVLALTLVSTGALAAQSRIGFVNMQRVILEYEKTRALTVEFEKQISARKADLAQDRARIQSLKENLDIVEQGSLEQLQKLKEIRLLEVELELKEKNVQILLEQRLVEHMKKVYDEVRREVSRIAAEKGLWAVFMITDGPLEGNTRDEVSGNILVRPVLWWDEKMDLTAAVVQSLNN